VTRRNRRVTSMSPALIAWRMTYSFGLDVFDYLRALQESVERSRLDYLNGVLAQDCACKAWHLREHVFRVPQVGCQFARPDDFRKYVTDACPELDLLRVVCNAQKHTDFLESSTGEVLTVRYHQGDFSKEFNRRDFNTDRLEIKLTDGRVELFDDVIDRAVSFWSQFFENHAIE